MQPPLSQQRSDAPHQDVHKISSLDGITDSSAGYGTASTEEAHRGRPNKSPNPPPPKKPRRRPRDHKIRSRPPPSSSSTPTTDHRQRPFFIPTLSVRGGRRSLATEASRSDSTTPGNATARAIRELMDASAFDPDAWLLHKVTHFNVRKERKKETPYKGACGGHRVHIGYTIIWGTWVRRVNVREVHRNIPAPSSLRDGGALRGACRARPMSVCGGPLMMGCSMVRWGCIRVCSVVSNSAG